MYKPYERGGMFRSGNHKLKGRGTMMSYSIDLNLYLAR